MPIPYQNPFLSDPKRRAWDFFLWRIGYYHDELSKRLPPAEFLYPFSPDSFDVHKDYAVWIGHSTFLVQSEGITILTDPVWAKRCSPFSFLGPKRRHAPPLSLDALPEIDFVLLSHNHYDHLDKKTVLALAKKQKGITWIVPLGLKKWFSKHRIENVYELKWWESLEFQKEKAKVSITATPSQHFSGRNLWDTNQTLWGGYVAKIDRKTLYFVGDTGYNPVDFKEIGKRFQPIDLSLIPIGTYSPREFMKTVHISPQEAVQIHREVGSRFSIGMHWKTFHLSDEPLSLPPFDLYVSMQEAKLPVQDFIAIEPGVYVNW